MGSLPIRRRGGQRRTHHPMPLPNRDGSAAVEVEGKPVRFGPQAKLCRVTMCCVCYALHVRRANTVQMERERSADAPPIDWTRLPTCDVRVSDPHHEPEGIRGDDDDTIPLCRAHHTGSDSAGFLRRHPGSARRFWAQVGIDWTEVRDEMRRRVVSRG